MQSVQQVLEDKGKPATFKELMKAPELGGPDAATRQKATTLFMGLLTYSQIGMVDLNQEFEGKQTLKDMKQGKFRNI